MLVKSKFGSKYSLIFLSVQVMRICLETISKTNPDEDEHAAFCLKWLSSVSRYAFNNVEEFISDIYASHILRTSMQCLSGMEVDMLLMKSYRSRRHLDQTEASDALPKYECAEFVSMLRDFGERFAAWPQLHGIESIFKTTFVTQLTRPFESLDMVLSQDSSAVIQTVLFCMNKSAPDICQKLVNVLVKNILSEMEADDIFSSSAVVHVLEVCLTVSDEEIFRHLYQSYFKGRLKSLAENFDLKFSVLKLLEAAKDKELVLLFMRSTLNIKYPLISTVCKNFRGIGPCHGGYICRWLRNGSLEFGKRLQKAFSSPSQVFAGNDLLVCLCSI